MYVFIAMEKEDQSEVNKLRVITQMVEHRSVGEWALTQHIRVAT
jgi:hypothetical protein